VGLDGPDPAGVQEPEPFQAVADASPVDLLQGRQLLFGRRDDDLPADLEGDAVAPAEIDEQAVAVPAVPGFQASGPVIDAAVDDPAVVPGLMGGDAAFLFDDHDPERGIPGLYPQGSSQTDDPGADDDDVRFHVRECITAHGRIGLTLMDPPFII